MSKLTQWISAIVGTQEHLINADAAWSARVHHTGDRVRGVERVVDHHLSRIENREIALSDFHSNVSNSRAFDTE